MRRTSRLLKRSLLGLLIAVQVVFYPAASFAAVSDTAPTPSVGTSTSICPPATPGVTQPTGAAEATYSFNPTSCLWENAYYTWSPITKQYVSKTPQEHTYNPTNNTWEVVPPPAPPVATPTVATTTTTPSGVSPSDVSAASSPTSASTNGTQSNGSSITSNTGPLSTNQINQNTNNNAALGLTSTTGVNNSIGSNAQTGDAGVLQNTKGGSATSGDAAATVNLLNMLQSSWGQQSGNVGTFVANLNGDVNGNLMIDPSQISTTGAGSLNTTNNTANNNLKVTTQTDGTINNNVNLNAGSGNATVADNTEAGNATSGNANAVADIVNMINSSIDAGHSFLGVININGNLNGDILLAPWLLNGLLANTGSNSTNAVSQTVNNSLTANLADSQAINNNVNATAGSGAATVADNTSAGGATSGSASTNITLLNLTGRQVIAKDALLVFVNVFGKWVGLIMNAPAGTNSALIAGTGANSTNNTNSTVNNTASINSTANSLINNNVTVNAKSGDANVSGNTVAGNAVSGNAHAGANIANLINSQFNISDWFGVLFINVFGNWNGSFGVQSPRSNQALGNGATGNSSNSNAATQPGVFGFVPKVNKISTAATTTTTPNNGHVAGATTTANDTTGSPTGAISAAKPSAHNPLATPAAAPIGLHPNWTLTIVGISSGLSLLGLERYLSFRRRLV